MRMICTSCSYVYDPAVGDPLNGVPPGVEFDELPEEWCCPLCYVGRDQFDLFD